MSNQETAPRKVRLLTRLRINEVSAVDRGAGEGVKIVLMKRDDEPPRSKPHVERAERAERIERRRREREEFEKTWGKTDAPRLFNDFIKADHDASEDSQHAPVVGHHASAVADLLVESGRHPDRAAALDHLLHNARGAALLRRLNKSEDNSMQHTTDTWQTLAKDFGVIAVAKHVTEHGAGSLNEGEFVALVTAHAQREHPGLAPDAAFAKVFCADDESGKILRQACAACKAWPAPLSIEPVMTGGADAFPSTAMRPGSSDGRKTRTEDGLGTSAYEQLQALAASQRRAGETAAQAFARIYAEPANASLAAAERAENRPAGGVRIVE
jgi:hypothetical protein